MPTAGRLSWGVQLSLKDQEAHGLLGLGCSSWHHFLWVCACVRVVISVCNYGGGEGGLVLFLSLLKMFSYFVLLVLSLKITFCGLLYKKYYKSKVFELSAWWPFKIISLSYLAQHRRYLICLNKCSVFNVHYSQPKLPMQVIYNNVLMPPHHVILFLNNNRNCAEESFVSTLCIDVSSLRSSLRKPDFQLWEGWVDRGSFRTSLRTVSLKIPNSVLPCLSKDTRILLLLSTLPILAQMQRQVKLPLGVLNKHRIWPLKEQFQAKSRWISRRW